MRDLALGGALGERRRHHRRCSARAQVPQHESQGEQEGRENGRQPSPGKLVKQSFEHGLILPRGVMIAPMRTLGFRTLLPAFVSAPPPAPPADSFTLEVMTAAVNKLREMNVPPFECEKCGAKVYAFLPPDESMPTSWMCDCGHVNPITTGERTAGCLLGQAREERAKVEHGMIVAGTGVVRSKLYTSEPPSLIPAVCEKCHEHVHIPPSAGPWWKCRCGHMNSSSSGA